MHALITGANCGIGAAIAGRLEARGDRVIRTARLGHASFVPLDVTDPASMAALAGYVVEPLDLLVLNAGIFEDRGEALDHGYPAEMWARMFATNVTGVFLTLQTLLPALRARRGKVAILSSQLGSHHQASGGSYIYRASKAAVLNLGRNLAAGLDDDGIAVGIYHPGWVRTGMGGSAAAIAPEDSAKGLVAEFDRLDLRGTRCVRTWDGRDHPL